MDFGQATAGLLLAGEMTLSRSILVRVTTMILPQVHLRKPCYDFSFL